MNTEWKLTIGEVLKHDIFQYAKVIAGSSGLSRPIRWVHIMESNESLRRENKSYISGGELILSTGIGFGKNATKRLSYLNELIQRQAAGLCIELGPYIPQIPMDMIEIANHYEFPLIVFEQPVRFVDITLDLHESIINKHNQSLRVLETYARELQQLTLQTPSLREILSHFQKLVHIQTFFLPKDQPPLFTPNMQQSAQSEIITLLDQTLLSQDVLPETQGSVSISDTKHILYHPVMAMGHVLAYIGVIIYETEPDEFLSLTLDYTVTAIAQILLRKMFALERSHANQNRLLEDILQNKITDEDQIRKLLGNNPKISDTASYWASIIEIQQDKLRYMDKTDSPFHDLLPVFRSILSRYLFLPLLLSKGNRLYLFLVETCKLSNSQEQLLKALTEVKRSCKQSLNLETDNLRFGISGISNLYANAYHTFKEAEQVLAFAEKFNSPFFNDLGVYRLLLQIEDNYSLNSFIEDYLGPLIHYDEKHDSQLLLTLRVYLNQSQSKQEASELLFIRRQSLYHRLEKIQELLGETYLSPEHRLCLELALRAYDWLLQN